MTWTWAIDMALALAAGFSLGRMVGFAEGRRACMQWLDALATQLAQRMIEHDDHAIREATARDAREGQCH